MSSSVRLISVGLAAVVLMAASLASAGTLDDVRKRGHLTCGINTGLVGFAAPDDKGVWRGFDVDVCRAVAAAVFGDAGKLKYKNLTGKTRSPRCVPARSTCCPATPPGPSAGTWTCSSPSWA